MPARDPVTRCACGETFLIEEDRIAHFIDVFVPGDDTGDDGQRHQQVGGDDTPRCACGAAFAHVDALDSHFEEMFVPPGNRGKDGRVHTGTMLVPPHRIPEVPS
jgi:hypothetical protein